MKVNELVEKFIKFEDENKILEKKFLNIYFWIFARIFVFIKLQNKIYGTKKWEKKKSDYKDKKNFTQIIKSLISIKNIKKKDYLIISHTRKTKINNKYQCQYTFFIKSIIKKKKSSYLEFEYGTQNLDFDKNKVFLKFYIEIFNFFAKLINSMFILLHPILKVTKYIDRIFKNFSIKPEKSFITQLYNILISSVLKKPFYKLLLKIIKPKIIFLVEYYSKENILICQIAKELNIKTVEFQHGPIIRNFIQYNFSEKKKNIIGLPEYFLSFGKSWVSSPSFPLKSEKKFNIGYAYLDLFLPNHSEDFQDKKILIISQPSVSHILIKFTLGIAKKTSKKIIFKLHPKERKLISFYKKKFFNYNNIYVDNSDYPYNSISSSEDIVGVNSTLLFEAIKFNKNICVVECDASQSVHKLDYADKFYFLKKPEDILNKKNQSQDKKFVNQYFKKFNYNYLKKTCKKIETN